MSCDYPIFLDVAGRLVVVVGGGTVAARRVGRLLACRARVRVVAPEVCPEIERRAGDAGLEIVRSAFSPAHMAGAFLVLACTDSESANAAAASAARSAGILVNRADQPDGNDFLVPAVSGHGQVRIAVSTGGASASLARRIRQWFDDNMPAEWAALAAELSAVRPRVLEQVRCPRARAALWELLCGDLSARLLKDKGQAAWREWFERVLAEHAGQGGTARDRREKDGQPEGGGEGPA